MVDRRGSLACAGRAVNEGEIYRAQCKVDGLLLELIEVGVKGNELEPLTEVADESWLSKSEQHRP